VDDIPWDSASHTLEPVLQFVVWTQPGSPHLQHRETITHLVGGQETGVHQMSARKEEEKQRY